MSGAHLLVRLGELTAALPASGVRHVMRTPRLYPLPGGGEGLLGLVEHAGEPLAVLDLAGLLGASPSGAVPAVTVVAWLGTSADRELVGLAVDEALEVLELDTGSATEGGGELLLADHPVRLVDLATLGEEAG